jgi:hypothetical protein
LLKRYENILGIFNILKGKNKKIGKSGNKMYVKRLCRWKILDK